MSLIFINYRRRDDAYAAALLDDRISRSFGSTQVFRASRSIGAGQDYELAILQAIEECRVMLVVIGPDWPVTFVGTASERNDWVRREIFEALKREIPVIPILLAGASRMSECELPADIAKITRLQYLRFGYRNLDEDTHRITAELARIIPEPIPPWHPTHVVRTLRTRFGR